MKNYKSVSEYSSGLDEIKPKRNENNKRPISNSNSKALERNSKKLKVVKKNMDIFD